MTGPFYITTSWDDGHPSDLRVAELLDRYGLKGTFYVPNRNSEGRPVMSAAEVGVIGQAFEVGAHSRDHVRLTTLRGVELQEQIVENKIWLEDVLAREMYGFCYVQGRYNESVVRVVKSLKFRYARTVQGLTCKSGFDRFLMPTSLQFFPHARSTLLRNFVRRPTSEPRLLIAAMASGALSSRVRSALQVSRARGEYFHLWGHSWELDAYELWEEFERTLGVLSEAVREGCEPVCNINVSRAFSAGSSG